MIKKEIHPHFLNQHSDLDNPEIYLEINSVGSGSPCIMLFLLKISLKKCKIERLYQLNQLEGVKINDYTARGSTGSSFSSSTHCSIADVSKFLAIFPSFLCGHRVFFQADNKSFQSRVCFTELLQAGISKCTYCYSFTSRLILSKASGDIYELWFSFVTLFIKEIFKKKDKWLKKEKELRGIEDSK